MTVVSILASVVLALTLLLPPAPAGAQDKPRPGGELIFVVPAEPPSFDAHREETFAMLHPGAPHRYEGSRALSRIALVKEVAGIQVPGTPWATPPVELEKLAGYGHDTNAARAEARRLLKEAGAENLSFTLLNRAVPQPYEPVGIWLIDQWRQVGLNVKQSTLETAAWLQAQKDGNFEVSTNAPCNSIVEPDMDLHWFLTTSPVNFSKHKDTVMDELYQKQSRALDPEERRRYLRAFEKRLYDDEVHYIMTFQWHRIVPHLAKVRGWQITPSHYLNNQLDTVWLGE